MFMDYWSIGSFLLFLIAPWLLVSIFYLDLCVQLRCCYIWYWCNSLIVVAALKKGLILWKISPGTC